MNENMQRKAMLKVIGERRWFNGFSEFFLTFTDTPLEAFLFEEGQAEYARKIRPSHMQLVLTGNYPDESIVRGYHITTQDGADGMIPTALIVSRIAEFHMYDCDFDASQQALKDGFCTFIDDMPGLEKGCYVDTPENRELCARTLAAFPELRVEPLYLKTADNTQFWQKYEEIYGPVLPGLAPGHRVISARSCHLCGSYENDDETCRMKDSACVDIEQMYYCDCPLFAEEDRLSHYLEEPVTALMGYTPMTAADGTVVILDPPPPHEPGTPLRELIVYYREVCPTLPLPDIDDWPIPIVGASV